ncbi:MAG: ABC transporter ATP-binding protein [Bryobacteraceae bacterium]|nr:ABC transporter ATP-binding protein [Bryobacteraceae bacterium]
MNPIEVLELTRDFGAVRAVDGVTFDVRAGTVFGLLGPNGAGKSTLLKLLVGHLRPTSGSVVVLGQESPRPERWLRMGYVAQSRHLPAWMTGEECLAFARSLRPRWDTAKAARIASRLDLTLKSRVGQLSRGQYVRLQLCLALGHSPELVVLDEPTSGLDPAGRREVLSLLIEEIARDGCTVVFSSHRVDDIERMADTVAILNGGRLEAYGPAEDPRGAGCPEEGAGSLERVYLEVTQRRTA